jgi:hypothetical protein
LPIITLVKIGSAATVEKSRPTSASSGAAGS